MPETTDPLTIVISTLCAVLVLMAKSLIDQLRRKRNGNGEQPERAGEKPPEFWQSEQRKAMTEVIVATVVPIMSQLATILAELKNDQATTSSQMVRLITLIEERMPRRGER